MPGRSADPKPARDERRRGGLSEFATRLLLIGVFACLGLVLWQLRDLVAIAFGALVLATGFRGIADALARRAHVPSWLALTGAVALCLGVAAAALQVFGSAMAAQYGELTHKLPESAHSVVLQLRGSPVGRAFLDEARRAVQSGADGSSARFVARAIALTTQGVTYALIMIAAGVFLAMDPGRYREGFLRLVPRSKRDRYREVLTELSDVLRRWLMGRVVVMAAVGVLSSLGLWALGIDAPFALGLTGAVLTFVPFVGPIAAALPAMLIGFLQEPMKAVVVALLFWFVHFIEGTFITPYVQDETVDIPPALSIFSTVVFGLLFGAVGVVLTGPFTVALMVLVERLYVEDVLGESPVAASSKKQRGWLRRLVAAR
jgi:predicted PurR-regulated permease PerM